MGRNTWIQPTANKQVDLRVKRGKHALFRNRRDYFGIHGYVRHTESYDHTTWLHHALNKKMAQF